MDRREFIVGAAAGIGCAGKPLSANPEPTPSFSTDVFVAGAGPSGFVAAIAAARMGARVTVADAYGFPGGMATAGLVGPISRVSLPGYEATGGIPMEFLKRLSAAGGARIGQPNGNVPFEAETYARIAREMLEEAGVKCLWQTQVCGAPELSADGAISSVTLSTSGFLSRLKAKTFIDATAVGALVGHHGFGAMRSRPGAAQPLSLYFHLGGVDTNKLKVLFTEFGVRSRNLKLRDGLQKAMEAGRIKEFGGPWAVWGSTLRPGCISVNATRTMGDATDPEAIARASALMRREIPVILDVFRETDPECFRDAYLLRTATAVGIRECRMVKALHCVTDDEYLLGGETDDTIGFGCHPVDIHRGGSSKQELTQVMTPRPIPLSCLISSECPNLLATGALASCEAKAYASMRVQAQCMIEGEAAGVAAAMAKGGDVRRLDRAAVRETLRRQGAIVHLKG